MVGGDAWSSARKDSLSSYLLQARGLTHNFYALRFAACELLNLLNTVGQIFFLDFFLGGSFADYGPSVFWSDSVPRVDTMDRVFPKATKCIFYYFGPTGSIQTLDSLCILPLNVVNEKIFVVLWFWYIVLSGFSFLALVYRAVVMVNCPVRIYLLSAQVRFMPRRKVLSLVQSISYGDWFFLRQLGKNLNPIVFRELLLDLDEKLSEKELM